MNLRGMGFFICLWGIFFVTACNNGSIKNEPGVYEAGIVRFKYSPEPGEDPETIYLTGDFNDWQPRNINYLMEFQSSGDFALDVTLDPGEYRFRFVINGNWITNMRNYEGRFEPVPAEFVEHDYGAVNALIKIIESDSDE